MTLLNKEVEERVVNLLINEGLASEANSALPIQFVVGELDA